jgi:RNA polymerase sigma-70 factor (ECF subfamily)
VLNNHLENKPTDKELVARTLGGDSKAFAIIIKNTEALVAQIVFRMVDHAEDRKDIAQDIYLKAYRKISGFRFESKLSTWIARIAYHTCINHLERKKPVLFSGSIATSETDMDEPSAYHQFSAQDYGNDTLAVVSKKELQSILWTEVEKLDPHQKTLVTLFHQEELSYDEISEITGMPIGTVKNYLFRARRALKDILLQKFKKEDL